MYVQRHYKLGYVTFHMKSVWSHAATVSLHHMCHIVTNSSSSEVGLYCNGSASSNNFYD